MGGGGGVITAVGAAEAQPHAGEKPAAGGAQGGFRLLNGQRRAHHVRVGGKTALDEAGELRVAEAVPPLIQGSLLRTGGQVIHPGGRQLGSRGAHEIRAHHAGTQQETGKCKR